MSRVVVKFGGTSVQDAGRIKKAAQSIIQQVQKGNEIVGVVSAMGGTTDTLINLLKKSTKNKIADKDYADFVRFYHIFRRDWGKYLEDFKVFLISASGSVNLKPFTYNYLIDAYKKGTGEQ